MDSDFSLARPYEAGFLGKEHGGKSLLTAKSRVKYAERMEEVSFSGRGVSRPQAIGSSSQTTVVSCMKLHPKLRGFIKAAARQ